MMPATSRRRSAIIDQRVGARIRMLRLERGLSQTSLGNALGLTFQQIQKYEKGTNAVASTRIPQLCRALKIEPNDLFDGVAFDKQEFAVGTFALAAGLRIEKLPLKARRALVEFLDLVEANSKTNSKKTRSNDNAAT